MTREKPNPARFETFANNALYYSFNTAKVGMAAGILYVALTAMERLARWTYRSIRGAINYWKEEIEDLKSGGRDAEQLALEKDEFVNFTEAGQSHHK